MEEIEQKYGLKLPRRVITIDYGEDIGDLPNLYPLHEEFTQKINSQDTAGLAKILKRLSFTAQTKSYLEKQQASQGGKVSCGCANV